MRNRASTAYWLSIWVLRFVFIAGALTALIGGLLRSRSIIRGGGAVFLFGGAIWGLANGGYLAWSYVRAGRKLGADVFAEDLAVNPVKSALFMFLTMFFIAAGIGLGCAAWKCAFPR